MKPKNAFVQEVGHSARSEMVGNAADVSVIRKEQKRGDEKNPPFRI